MLSDRPETKAPNPCAADVSPLTRRRRSQTGSLRRTTAVQGEFGGTSSSSLSTRYCHQLADHTLTTNRTLRSQSPDHRP